MRDEKIFERVFIASSEKRGWPKKYLIHLENGLE